MKNEASMLYRDGMYRLSHPRSTRRLTFHRPGHNTGILQGILVGAGISGTCQFHILNTLLSSYYSPAGGIFVFPFHWSCFRLLCRVILGHFNYDVLDKNALYDAMSQGKKYDSLDLPYGDITGNDQDWQSIPGEEVRVLSID